MQEFNQVIIITGVYIYDNKLVIMIEPKTISFSLAKKVDNSLKHKIDIIRKHNGCLAEQNKKQDWS